MMPKKAQATRPQKPQMPPKKVDTANGPHYKDVPQGSSFYDHVETLHNQKIIAGFKDGTFRPDDKVTRGRHAKLPVLAAALTLTTCKPISHFVVEMIPPNQWIGSSCPPWLAR